MTNTFRRENRLALVLLGLLLLAAAGVTAWIVWPRPSAPPAQAPLEERRAENRPTRPPPLDDRPRRTGNEDDETPTVEPENEPEFTGEAVELPLMSRFRALLTEADSALAVRDNPDAPRPELWKHASTLEQLESRFAPFAMAAVHEAESDEDRRHFEREASRSFERPDVATETWTVEANPRLAIWGRPGSKFPPAETEPPEDVNVPQERRLHEDVNVDEASRWLAAIESEYGEGTFGDHGIPLDVIVFPDLSSYLTFSKLRLGLEVPAWSAGYYSSRWEVISLPVLSSTSAAEVIRHEMFHAVQAHRAPASLTVPWFAEGSAEWLDKSPPDDGELNTHEGFAAAAYGYLRQLVGNGYRIDLASFLAMEMEEFYASPELNYLLAYCFVDFCRGEEDLRQTYFQFWEIMCGGALPDNAFARSFGGLDMAAVERRFLARINRAPLASAPPQFSHDAPAEHFDKVPTDLSRSVAPPGAEGGISQGWYPVLGALHRRGFDTSRPAHFDDDYDRLIVAIDSSVSMGGKITEDGFDFEALSVWLFSLRYAGNLSFNRRSDDGSNAEEIPPLVTLSLVDAVVSDRAAEFTETTGIRIPDEIRDDVLDSHDTFSLTAEALAEMTRRDIALHTAESISWFWNTRQGEADVTVVDFNMEVMVERERGESSASGLNTTDGPLRRLFAKTGSNAAPAGSDGADTDWWMGFQEVVKAARGGKSACLFFTDGPNSLGFYGHIEGGRDEFNYVNDQSKLAQALSEEWEAAGLDESLLQLVALPGAESQGLELIPQKLPQARLDEWAVHFKSD